MHSDSILMRYNLNIISPRNRCGLLLQTAWRGLSVLVITMSHTKTAKPIEMPFGAGHSAAMRAVATISIAT